MTLFNVALITTLLILGYRHYIVMSVLQKSARWKDSPLLIRGQIEVTQCHISFDKGFMILEAQEGKQLIIKSEEI